MARRLETPQTLVSDGTPLILTQLAEYPTVPVTCLFADGQHAMTIWYMRAGCIALSVATDIGRFRLRDFKVQALCAHHTDRQEPLGGTAQLLVDLTWGKGSDFPDVPWAASGPHWSDTVGENGDPLPPALELGYDRAKLQDFAGTELGRLVFAGYEDLLS